MSQPQGTLLGILSRRAGTAEELQEALEAARSDLGLGETQLLSPVCAAYSLLRLNFQVEQVSRLLSWREFEHLAASLFRAAGFEVMENVFLTRPRAQIDVVASGASLVLCVDCKHYRKEQGPAVLDRFALAQLRRSDYFKKSTQDSRPVASVILSMSEPEGKFVRGVAIVPVRTLRSFLNSLDSYVGFFELR